MQLNKRAFGLAAGIIWGVTVLVATVVAIILGKGEHIVLLKGFYLGFSISPVGALVGLIWGFLDGFICGWIFAWLYNRLAG